MPSVTIIGFCYQGSSWPAQGCVDHDRVVVQCRDWRVTMELLNKLSVFPNFRLARNDRVAEQTVCFSQFPLQRLLRKLHTKRISVRCLFRIVMWSMPQLCKAASGPVLVTECDVKHARLSSKHATVKQAIKTITVHWIWCIDYDLQFVPRHENV